MNSLAVAFSTPSWLWKEQGASHLLFHIFTLSWAAQPCGWSFWQHLPPDPGTNLPALVPHLLPPQASVLMVLSKPSSMQSWPGIYLKPDSPAFTTTRLIFLNPGLAKIHPYSKPLMGLLSLMSQPSVWHFKSSPIELRLSRHRSLPLPLEACLLLLIQSVLCAQTSYTFPAQCLCPQHSPCLNTLTFSSCFSKVSVLQCPSVLLPPRLTLCPEGCSFYWSLQSLSLCLLLSLIPSYVGSRYLSVFLSQSPLETPRHCFESGIPNNLIDSYLFGKPSFVNTTNLLPFPSGDDGLVTKLCVTLVTPWTVACHVPLSMGFSRQEYWNGFSRGSSRPRDKTWVSYIASGFFTDWATREVTFI